METTSPELRRKTVGLMLLGGLHHILHLIPVASALETHAHIDVIIYVRKPHEIKACQEILDGLGATRTQIEIMKPNPLMSWIYPKRSLVLSNIKTWRTLDALMVAERTSTVLRRFFKDLPIFIHTRHGVGDRAKGFDPRIARFDYVMVAGPKDKGRMIELDLVTDENCFAIGYIKPFVVDLIHPEIPKFFKNDNPVVLYTPHFERSLSSWDGFGAELLEAFAKRKDMNFIIAPHMRLFAGKNAPSKAVFETLKNCENIHVDLGSQASTDMSYTRAADIYIGDVSSQVYEFLSKPKPCIFIGDEATEWQGNPDYAHWSYGPVCHSAADVMSALSTAEADLPSFTQAQEQGCLAAKGGFGWDPIQRASDVIVDLLARA